ncbi:MAG: FadR/GntR family transcriptional regulator [Candidatus Velthaea sp.]
MAKFLPVVATTPNLPTLITDQLRAQIAAGVLAPGERLPAQRELAASLNVSRSALREATAVLESIGVVETFHGRGTFVAKSDTRSSLRQALSPQKTAVIARRELTELCQLRYIVEPAAAALAARAIKRKDVRRLHALCDQADALLERNPSDLETITRLNTELHASIARASRNALLAGVIDDLMRLLGEIRRSNMRRPGRARDSWSEHRSIVDALEAGDAARAEILMVTHIEHAAHATSQPNARPAR